MRASTRRHIFAVSVAALAGRFGAWGRTYRCKQYLMARLMRLTPPLQGGISLTRGMHTRSEFCHLIHVKIVTRKRMCVQAQKRSRRRAPAS